MDHPDYDEWWQALVEGGPVAHRLAIESRDEISGAQAGDVCWGARIDVGHEQLGVLKSKPLSLVDRI